MMTETATIHLNIGVFMKLCRSLFSLLSVDKIRLPCLPDHADAWDIHPRILSRSPSAMAVICSLE